MPGFTMGPAQKTNKIDPNIGQNENIVCRSFSSSGVAIDSINAAVQTFNIEAAPCSGG